MASSSEFVDFVRDRFYPLEDIVTFRPMMGEYVIHMAGRVLGFVCDEQLVFEPGPTMERLAPNLEKRELFPGSKLFYIIPDSFSAREVCALAEAIYDDLPVKRARKSKKGKAEKTDNNPFARLGAPDFD